MGAPDELVELTAADGGGVLAGITNEGRCGGRSSAPHRTSVVDSFGSHKVEVPHRLEPYAALLLRMLVGWRPGFPSTFPPPDAWLRGTGRNGRGRRVTTEAVDRPLVHATADERGRVGLGRDEREDGGSVCKTAGFAYTGSNPVPATLPLTCANAIAA